MPLIWKVLVILTLILALIGGYLGWKANERAREAYDGARETRNYLRDEGPQCPPPPGQDPMFFCWVKHTTKELHDLMVLVRDSAKVTVPNTDSHGPPPPPPPW